MDDEVGDVQVRVEFLVCGDELSKQRAIGMGPHLLLESSESRVLLKLVVRLIRCVEWLSRHRCSFID